MRVGAGRLARLRPPFCSMRFGDLTFEEIREEITAGAIAVVPMGCTEQQGPHLPVDFDSWFAETLASEGSERASEQHGIRSLVLPTLPFGPTPEHVNFGAGYVDLPAQQHDAILVAVLGSLFDQGFSKVVVWRGCGGHDLSGAVGRGIERSRVAPRHALRVDMARNRTGRAWGTCR